MAGDSCIWNYFSRRLSQIKELQSGGQLPVGKPCGPERAGM